MAIYKIYVLNINVNDDRDNITYNNNHNNNDDVNTRVNDDELLFFFGMYFPFSLYIYKRNYYIYGIYRKNAIEYIFFHYFLLYKCCIIKIARCIT